MRLLLSLLLLLLMPLGLLAQPIIELAVPFSDNTDKATYTTGAISVPLENNLGIGICITSGELSTVTPLVGPPTYSLGGGQAFTEIITAGAQPTNEDLVTIWYLVGPTVGTTGTISWTHTGTVTSSAASIFVLSGAAQSNPTVAGKDPSDDGASHSTSWSVPLTTTVDNSLLITCGVHGNPSIEYTQGAGQTEQFDLGANAQRHSTSTEVKVTAGLETLTAEPASGSPAGRFAAIAVGPAMAGGGGAQRSLAPVQFR